LRRLAETRPDAFRPDLAAALNNLSGRLADLGRRQEALTAVNQAAGIYRQLAEAHPDTFLPDLATALANQSNCLADIRAPDIAAWLRGVAGLLIWSFVPFPCVLKLVSAPPFCNNK
jgi:hypothetical protein